MSQENVEIVRSAFAAFEGGDVSHLIELMADDLVTQTLDNTIYHGKEGFFQATAEWIEGFEDWTVTAEEFLDAGDDVLVQVHQTARGKSSGVPVESHFWFLFAIDERKIARLSFHTKKVQALEAAGLSE